MDIKTRKNIESLVFKKLVKHFRQNTKVQNIDLMNLAGFCRNCLSKWYMSSAKKNGIQITYDEAKLIISKMRMKSSVDFKDKKKSPQFKEILIKNIQYL